MQRTPDASARFLKTVLIAGITAGTLDLALAIIFFAVQKGAPLVAVPHAIASGLLGDEAFRGGLATAALGVVLHFFIALCVAAVYYALSRKIKLMNRFPLIAGAVYGLGVFAFMLHVVLPRSAAEHSRPSQAWLIADISSHIFFIGITIALITRRYSAPTGARVPIPPSRAPR